MAKVNTKKKTYNTKKSSGSGSKKASGASSKKTVRKEDREIIDTKKNFYRSELTAIIAGLLGLFLLLTDFGLLGTLGGIFLNLQKGLLGQGYFLLSAAIIAAVVVLFKYRDNYFAPMKAGCVFGILIVVCAFIDLLMSGLGSEKHGVSIGELYSLAADGAAGGGLIGGLISDGLKSLIGFAGTAVLLLALLLVFVVFIFEVSFINFASKGARKTAVVVKKSADRTFEAARSGHEQYRQYQRENAERRAALREERKRQFLAEDDYPEDGYRNEGYSRDGYSRDGYREEDFPQPEERRMQMSDISLPKEQAASSGSIFDRLDSSDNAGSIERQTTYAERYGRQIIGEEPARQENRDITPAEDRDIVPTEADYESDEVPFEETEEDIYKSYTYLLKNGIISIDNARRAGFAVGRGNDTSRPSGSSVFDSENREPQHFDAFKVRDDQRNLPGAAEAPGYGDNGYKAPSYEDNGYPGYDAQEPSGYEAQRDEDDYINSGFNAEDIEADDPDSYYDTESASNEENVGGIYSDNYGSDDDTYVTATGKTMETPDRYEAEKIMKKKLGASAVPLRGASGAASGAAASSSAAAASSGSTGKAGQAQSRQAAADPARQAAAKPKPKKKKPYVFPDISLLEKGTRSADNNRGALMANAGKLEKVFRDFGVGVTVTNVTVGPRVSRYELTPDAGVKVSRITSLSGDIKLALAARDIRIEAPIPGKSAVGIEVPNESSTAVKFRDILESEQFKNAKSPLTWGVGLDIGGNTVTCDIAKMPHILVAGTTGSGKSVGINSLIMSILYRCRPEDVRMILVDPKQVEFVVYNGIPHLLTNVVTTPERALSTLNWAVAEMNRRYSLFQQSGTRNIAGYNERVVKAGADLPPEERPEKLPFILIIIDELSELMMHAKKDVESAIVSLAQLARAAGIHLVVATQRPSVDVVTGLIKSNIPSRVAFKLPSITDSRTILDSGGAEALLGNGDMLYKPSDRSSPARVQGAFLKDEEVESVVEFIRKHNPPDTDPEIDTAITKQMELNFSGQQSGGTDKGKNESDLDEFFADAGRLITTSQKASIGGLQRKFKIGFNRAARIMDQLCEAGVVSSGEGTKERQILMDAETFENYLNENGV